MPVFNNVLRYFTSAPTRCTVAVGVLLVLWQSCLGTIPFDIQLIFTLTFVFLTGIPHGALDHLVEAETAARTQHQYNLIRFLLKYLLVIGIYAMIWHFFPICGLLLFLIFSAWHFGETDLEKLPLKVHLWTLNRFLHGAFVLSWLLLGHAAETTPVLERITRQTTEEMWVWRFFVAHRWQLLLNGWVLISVLVWVAQRWSPVSFDVTRMFRLFIVLLLCQALPLLLAFTLYFAGWHSISAFQTIWTYLNPDPARSRRYSWWQFWLSAMPFTLLAMASIVVLTWGWQRYAKEVDPLPLLFIFLSLVTLPHLQVMHRMNNRLTS